MTHYEDLQHQVNEYYSSSWYTVEQTWDNTRTFKTATLRLIEIPPVWALLVGDVMHNLRSALDHAVFELSDTDGVVSINRIEFPIFENEDEYNNGCKQKLKYLPIDFHQVIYDCQPFNQRRTQNNSPIVPVTFAIHRLNIIDKHRQLHLMHLNLTHANTLVLRTITPHHFGMPMPILHDGAILGEWQPTIHDDEDDLQFMCSSDIVLSGTDSELDNQRVLHVCTRCIAGVKTVLNRLEAVSYSPPDKMKPAQDSKV